MNIFFTSDTHFHHKNIVRGCSAWEDRGGEQQTRDFDTLEEHDAALVQNINSVVKENDILYHLGDWSFGGLNQIWEFRKRLNCKKIHLILGNHDHHIENNKYIQLEPTNENYLRTVDILGNGQMSCTTKQLFMEVRDKIRTRKIGGQEMTLDHFAQRIWEKSHHGTWCLYGHSHGTLPDYSIFEFYSERNPPFCFEQHRFKTMDVGVDTHPEFRPYHFDEIAAIMKNRIPLRVDHHNEKTN